MVIANWGDFCFPILLFFSLLGKYYYFVVKEEDQDEMKGN